MRCLLGLMAILLAACGCTAEGCGHDLRFNVATFAEWAGSDAYVIEACVGGRCESRKVSESPFSHWFSFPLDDDVSGAVEVEVTITVGSVVKRASGQVELSAYRPNGRFCTPVCSGADVTVDGDSVRNAEPGLIAPRD